MRWQKRARVLVALIGIASAFAVYATMSERAQQRVAPAPERTDPRAMIESSGNVLQQVRGSKQDYVIEADRQLTYQGGATKLINVKVTVRHRAGRDYVVTGREAEAGENQKDLRLSGGVTLQANDGFVVRTDSATFNQDDGLMTAPGAVKFSRGRMNGSGVGMSYDRNADVLTLSEQSHVQLTDEHGATSMEFVSGKSTFARLEHTLALEGNVHALREGQVIDAATGVAHFTDDEQRITDIELRGGARVSGGGSGVDSMSARDIDLHYAEDGIALEHVALVGQGAVTMTGKGGATGRRFVGEALDIALASDGSVTKATGSGNVQLDLPANTDAPRRTIKARTLAADGAPGKGLTAATFTDDVEFREDGGAPPAAARTARSRALTIALDDDAVKDAAFTGAVRFDEQGLQAVSGDARYDPAKGTLRLTRGESAGVPRVSDEQVAVDANAIDVVLEGRRIRAAGGVKTTLRSHAQADGGGAQGAGTNSKLPSLLKQDQAANVNGDALDYQGASGQAIYTGNATLWQGETAIRADAISIDQAKGDLVATGNARSSIVLDTGVSIARAADLRYTDAAHTITYTSSMNRTAPGAIQAQLSGPQGDLRADRIDAVLAVGGGHLERLEAYTNVIVKLDARTATGDRLTYFSDDERYLLSGGGAKPVKILESCKETTGKTLTFFKSTDRIIVDGNEEIRTQTKNGVSAACNATPRSR